MKNERFSVIDLGTNTFNLIIAEPDEKSFKVVHREQIGVKIGQGGISKGYITEAAQERLFRALKNLTRTIQAYQVESDRTWAVATSAFRHAKNAREIIQKIQTDTDIPVEVISGNQEAEYIYFGVKTALQIGETNALVVDIGGGSVEFIICNERKIHWKKSFEIGGQRLMDQFMRTDPISELDIQRMEIYLESQLLELSMMSFNYGPKVMIGASGAFDTLSEIEYRREHGDEHIYDFVDEFHHLRVKEHVLSIDDFHYICQDIVRNDRDQRLQIPGMIEMRVDMIVVATILIRFILEKLDLDCIRVSSYALKEGYLMRKMILG
ncbi:MAG: phosphatase [Bacteroidia bacterium]|nr:phosphatase [Bacteroidia bacterium]